MKRLHRRTAELFPESRRERIQGSLNRQNQWARRAGLPLLTFSINILLASMVLTTSYFLILGLYEGGYLAPPAAGESGMNSLQSPR